MCLREREREREGVCERLWQLTSARFLINSLVLPLCGGARESVCQRERQREKKDYVCAVTAVSICVFLD